MARRSNFTVLVVLALAALACNLTEGVGEPPAAEVDAPLVEIRIPANNTAFAEGTRVIVQAVATDSGSGVSRVELLVDDLVVGTSPAPSPAGQAAYVANLEWVAQGVGLHSITVVAFRADDTMSAPVTIAVNVTDAEASLQPQETEEAVPLTELATAETRATATVEQGPVVATETPQEAPPTAAPTTAPPPPTDTPGPPSGTVTIGLNVRSGPGVNYPIQGALAQGSEVELLGRDGSGFWLVVPYGVGQGWVSAQFVNTTTEILSLPVVQAPPPPPPTAPPLPPTATPIPATAPPTAPPALPDLVIDSVAVDPPFPPRVGVTMSVTVTIRNQGQAAAEGFLVGVSFGYGANSESTQIAFPPIEPGQSATNSGFVTMPAASLDQSGNANVTVDADNRVQESVENNNLHATAPYVVEAAQ